MIEPFTGATRYGMVENVGDWTIHSTGISLQDGPGEGDLQNVSRLYFLIEGDAVCESRCPYIGSYREVRESQQDVSGGA